MANGMVIPHQNKIFLTVFMFIFDSSPLTDGTDENLSETGFGSYTAFMYFVFPTQNIPASDPIIQWVVLRGSPNDEPSIMQIAVENWAAKPFMKSSTMISSPTVCMTL